MYFCDLGAMRVEEAEGRGGVSAEEVGEGDEREKGEDDGGRRWWHCFYFLLNTL